MATSTESKKMITLYSSDGEEFEIEESVAKKFWTNSKKPKVIKHPKKMITLLSSEGLGFVIKESEAVESQTIKRMFKDDCAKRPIYLPYTDGEVLSKVVEYLVKHADSSSKSDKKTADEELKAWDAEFVKVNEDLLHALNKAASDLEIDRLVNLCTRTVPMKTGKHQYVYLYSADE